MAHDDNWQKRAPVISWVAAELDGQRAFVRCDGPLSPTCRVIDRIGGPERTVAFADLKPLPQNTRPDHRWKRARQPKPYLDETPSEPPAPKERAPRPPKPPPRVAQPKPPGKRVQSRVVTARIEAEITAIARALPDASLRDFNRACVARLAEIGLPRCSTNVRQFMARLGLMSGRKKFDRVGQRHAHIYDIPFIDSAIAVAVERYPDDAITRLANDLKFALVGMTPNVPSMPWIKRRIRDLGLRPPGAKKGPGKRLAKE